MESKLIKLIEEDESFVIRGSAYLGIRKRSGFILMRHPLKKAIPNDNVLGLVIDENALYLDWRRSTIKEHTYLGEIEDIEQARTFVSKVNLLYRQNAC